MLRQKRADVTLLSLPPKPLVLTPSGTFDGDDGKWSTFNINLAGDGEGMGQNFKVLISTSSPITLVPAQTGDCDEQCAKSRGVLDTGALGFNAAPSDTYQSTGLYDLSFKDLYWWSQSLLPPGSNGTLNGAWGQSTVGLGLASKQSITVPKQYIAMYYFSEFYLGSLGLAVGTVSPTGAVLQTFFSGLAGATDVVASNSYGFTAGASYRNGGRGVVGNMVFGGYDRSRAKMLQGVSIPLPSQQNNTLIVGVNSIIHTPDQDVEQGSVSFTDRGFSAIIDSTLPYLVLPGYICDRFIEKFGLTFDNTTALYTVNSTAHERNQQQNATIAFKISAQPQDSSTSTTIVFPYEAFFLQVSDPIYSPSQNYFPIRKSSNGYNILGRSFLQEAYIVVDYERANFTVAPAAVFSGAMPIEDLVTIYNTTYVPPKGVPSSQKAGLSAGAIAGIVIGIIVVLLLIGGGAFLYYRRRREAKKRVLEQEGKPAGIDTIVAGGEVKHRRVSELTGSEAPYSPQTKPVGYYGGDHKSIPELSPESHPAELYSPPLDGHADYFASGPKPRRRGATRDSSGQNTPGTPIAELSGGDGLYQGSGQHLEAISPLQRPQHIRGPSDKSLSTGIDEIMSGRDRDIPEVPCQHSSKFVEHTGDECGPWRAEMIVSPLENTRIDGADTAAEPAMERRTSHARGLSDITINSDSTAVSQPTPEEMDRWARSGDNATDRSATK